MLEKTYESQVLIDRMLVVLAGFIDQHGDDGVKNYAHSLDLRQQNLPIYQHEELVSYFATMERKDNELLEILLNEYVKGQIKSDPPNPDLNRWVLSGLMRLSNGMDANDAFGIFNVRGPKSNLGKKIQIACYFRLVKSTGESYETACLDCSDHFQISEKTVRRYVGECKIPDISNTALETISRIGLDDIF